MIGVFIVPESNHFSFNKFLILYFSPDVDELKFATKAMQDRKAAGVDEMVNEILKLDEFHPLLLNIINQSYVTKSVPSEWLISILIPVFKKGDSSNPNNYRGIALMCVCAKLYNRLLLERLRAVLDPH
jgi:hypothetical protein